MFSCDGIEVPMEIVLSKILPLLDRKAFDRLSATCKDIHHCLLQVLPPWPDRLVANDHLCQMKVSALSCNGTVLAGGCSDGRVRLWHVQSGEQKPLEGHWPDEPITHIAFGRENNNLLASASTDHTIIIWDLDISLPTSKRAKVTLKCEPTKIHTPYVSDMHFSPDDRMLITVYGTTETIKIWNVVSGNPIRTMSSRRVCPLDSPMDLAAVPAHHGVTIHHDSGRSNSVRIWTSPLLYSETTVPG
jgi:WD40 repeat protein